MSRLSTLTAPPRLSVVRTVGSASSGLVIRSLGDRGSTGLASVMSSGPATAMTSGRRATGNTALGDLADRGAVSATSKRGERTVISLDHGSLGEELHKWYIRFITVFPRHRSMIPCNTHRQAN